MTSPTRRITLCAVTAALVAGAVGCADIDGSVPRTTKQGAAATKRNAPAEAPESAVRLIGDGSTAYTGVQPHVSVPHRLKPGQKPPQFVVFSWDGAGEDSQKLFSHFRAVGKKYDATMTYFLSGVYMLPGAKKEQYDPPQHVAGSSDIGFNDAEGIRDTVTQLRGAWLDGNEIGTHFNGHFCGPDGGVGTWSVPEWKSEITQAKAMVKHWRTNTGLTGLPPLPFDYDKELAGGRSPCLEGQHNLLSAAREMGFRYDASGNGLQVWPKRREGVWDIPLQEVPVPGRAFETLSMDYNFMFNQSRTVHGDPAMYTYWGDQMRDGLLRAFDRSYNGNRAPLIMGNHFESWNGGTYMRAVEQTIAAVCTRPEVRCVPFKQLVNWLEAQDPKTVGKLQGLAVGEAPKEGWAAYLSPQPSGAAPGRGVKKQG
ncbi:hypothetical protein [Streptomyces sp. A 4/2]|uniref:hypothetical protein n=1 Tax=Streptomyces sp. A 4/2 TaxID=2934314 RepID=UPI002023E302|nr:hypothetical protein [Streptomyces sp. A 4/2]